MSKSDSWFPLSVYLGVFLAGVCVACVNPVGLSLAGMGGFGFLVLFIWDKIYTDNSLHEKEKFYTLSRKVTELAIQLECAEKVTSGLTKDFAHRLDELEAKSKSIQTTVSFLKGK